MSEIYNNSFTVSWDQLHKDTRLLAKSLAKLPDFEGIAAIARGGLIPAAIIARELDIRFVETICISSYDHDNQKSLNIIKQLEDKGSKWIIIDDLVDTGKTARVAKNMMPNAHFACIYAKPLGKSLADSFITEVNQDTWVFFPWDTALLHVPPIVGNPKD